MIGDMFNHALKAKVEQLCNELAEIGEDGRLLDVEKTRSGQDWWPNDLGRPSAVGSQNGHAYACFPQARRLAIRGDDGIRLYDTGDHRISGVSQQQGGARDLRFTSQHGAVRLSDLHRVEDERRPPTSTTIADETPARRDPPPEHNAATPKSGGDVLGLIERLHDLQRNGVLTAEEFAAKKTELLARL